MISNEETAQGYSIVGNQSVKATESPNELKGAKDANEIEALKTKPWKTQRGRMGSRERKNTCSNLN